MTSARAQAANRQNAKASTGPRTAAGRMRASQNARKHGLAAVTTDPGSAAFVDALMAQLIAERGENSMLGEAARAVAEAEAFLRRVLAYKRALMQKVDYSLSVQTASTGDSALIVSELLDALDGLERYERRADSRRRSALRRLEALSPRPG